MSSGKGTELGLSGSSIDANRSPVQLGLECHAPAKPLRAKITIAKRLDARLDFLSGPPACRKSRPNRERVLHRNIGSALPYPVTQGDKILLVPRRSLDRSSGFTGKRRWHCPCSSRNAATIGRPFKRVSQAAGESRLTVTTMKAQVARRKARSWHSHSGRTMVEVLAVVAIATILTAVAVPQIISARRLIRSASLPREIASQLRYARQQAMSQRQAFTFVYNDSTKQISIIDHQTTGTSVLSASGYPNTTGSVNALTIPVAGGGGLPSSEVTFGVPTGITNTTLGDTSTPTALVANQLTVTFQPDGTVLDANGNATNRTLFFYNNKVPNETAFAISILGTAGRIKIWRYTTSASAYVE